MVMLMSKVWLGSGTAGIKVTFVIIRSGLVETHAAVMYPLTKAPKSVRLPFG
jgi:hypothetical protein